MKIIIKESRFSVRDANSYFLNNYLDDLKREGESHEEIKRQSAEKFIASLTRYISDKYNDDIASYEANSRNDGDFDVKGTTENYEVWGRLKVRDNYTINYKKSTVFLYSDRFDNIKTL